MLARLLGAAVVTTTNGLAPRAGEEKPVFQLRLVAIALAIFALAGCTAGASDSSQPAATKTVKVTLNDDMSIEVSQTAFAVGETVVFQVTNAGSVPHELYLGDAEAQAEHAEEMAETDGMAHDEPDGVSVAPGGTETLEYTFTEAGEILAGCHEPGHYEAGMVTALTVVDE